MALLPYQAGVQAVLNPETLYECLGSNGMIDRLLNRMARCRGGRKCANPAHFLAVRAFACQEHKTAYLYWPSQLKVLVASFRPLEY